MASRRCLLDHRPYPRRPEKERPPVFSPTVHVQLRLFLGSRLQLDPADRDRRVPSTSLNQRPGTASHRAQNYESQITHAVATTQPCFSRPQLRRPCHQTGKSEVPRRPLTEPVQALVDMPELKSRIKGMLFLGTPHRGTPFTRFGIIAASFLTPLDADVEIMRPLMSDSVDLDDLEKKFSRHFHSTRRIYYFETHKMRRYVLGFLPGVREFVSQALYLCV